MLTPESSIEAQKDFGADIIIPFDELPPYHISAHDLKKSIDRTHRWEQRSLENSFKKPPRASNVRCDSRGGRPGVSQNKLRFSDKFTF